MNYLKTFLYFLAMLPIVLLAVLLFTVLDFFISNDDDLTVNKYEGIYDANGR